MDKIELLKSYEYLGNTLWEYTMAIVVFVTAMVLLMIFQSIILRHLKKLAEKTVNDFDDAMVGIASSIKPPLYFVISLYLGYRFLNFSDLADNIVNFLFFVILALEVIKSFGRLVDYFIEVQTRKMENEGEKEHIKGMMRILKNFILLGLAVLAILLILSNYGVNVTSVLASLGIGGLAIALAVQNILSDIFSSFSIFVDKPFQIGDFIVVGTDMGNVQKIGLKTTRIKTLQGQELIVSNQELTSTRVENYKRMEKRRVVFSFGVTYGTDSKKLEKIPEVVKKVIESRKKTSFDRCHFKDYGDFSLNYEVVYYVESPEYGEYMDAQQDINLDLYKKFEKEKIDFAYPTQTIHMAK
jgi:small-conductance mechanosensitive channel